MYGIEQKRPHNLIQNYAGFCFKVEAYKSRHSNRIPTKVRGYIGVSTFWNGCVYILTNFPQKCFKEIVFVLNNLFDGNNPQNIKYFHQFQVDMNHKGSFSPYSSPRLFTAALLWEQPHLCFAQMRTFCTILISWVHW